MEQLFTIIKNNLSVIRWWQDGLDILLVSILLYKLMQLIRESSAGQVLKGVLIFILATQLVGLFQLNMLYYLLSQTMQIGILALIVLFQPELRRMLDSVGRSRLLPSLTPSGKAHPRKPCALSPPSWTSPTLCPKRKQAC